MIVLEVRMEALENPALDGLSTDELAIIKTALATQMWSDESARDREVRGSKEWSRRNTRWEKASALYLKVCKVLEGSS
jgi:hypothetical protein